MDNLSEKIPSFLIHTFTKRAQSNYFQLKILRVPASSAIIQVDFSENYSLQDQGEVQSAHWYEEQLTLFTVCVWMYKIKKSFVFVSDDLDHDKTLAIVFMNELLKALTREYGINNFDIFSDGPSSQFKNQFVFNYLPNFCNAYDIEKLSWNFFASSHGKGAVDGIGGTVKHDVWMATLVRKIIVHSLDDFYAAAKKLSRNIEIIKLSAAEITTGAEKLNLASFFANLKAIKGIKKQHFVTMVNNGQLACKEYSSQVQYNNMKSFNESDEMMDISSDWYEDRCQQLAPKPIFTEGDFVEFIYSGEHFPGMVTFVHPNRKEIRIKSMERCAGGWRWPHHDDEIYYPLGDVVKTIGFPVPVNNRGTYQVADLP